MKRKRRNHSSCFKAKGALDVLKGEMALAERADKHDVHPNPIPEWKKRLLEHANRAFGGDKATADAEAKSRCHTPRSVRWRWRMIF